MPANSRSERWGACGILLSLDCMQPFIKPMGLQLETESLKLAAREVIIVNRTAFEQGHHTKPTFAARLLECIDSRFGERARRHFVLWFSLVFTFDVHDHYEWQQWHSAFLRFSGSFSSWEQLGIPSKNSWFLYEKYLAMMHEVDIWALWKEKRRNPLSDWDLEMYAIHDFDDESRDPFNWVVLTYETNCFRRFWSELRMTLTDQDLNDIWHRLKSDPKLQPNSHMHHLPDPLTLSIQELE
jgi:hypothetical protein